MIIRIFKPSQDGETRLRSVELHISARQRLPANDSGEHAQVSCAYGRRTQRKPTRSSSVAGECILYRSAQNKLPPPVLQLSPAINARHSGRRSLRIRLRARDVIGVPVLNPFRHVSGHVVQAVAVGRKTADGTGVGHRAFVVVRMAPLGLSGDVHAQSQRRPRRPLAAPWA